MPISPSYEDRGVSPDKPDVRAALEGIPPGLFPGAFCSVVPDVLTGSSLHCLLMHADGAGTKSILAYLQYCRSGNADIFKGIAQDSLVMNLDDLLCAGATGPFVMSNTIGRNAKIIGGDIIRSIIIGYTELLQRLDSFGIHITSCGGETADVGDLVRTVIVDSTLITRMPRKDLIDCSQVRPGHVIVGFASDGKASYEDNANSGIGTNGFTALRHCLLSHACGMEQAETYALDIADLAYQGKYDLNDPMPDSPMTIGEACLSPTRSYAPIIKKVLEECRASVSAIFHNTGGGQTKCLGFGSGVRYEKLDLFSPPPIFRLIREVAHLSVHEMVRVFNLGHRLEVICDRSASDEIIGIAANFNVKAKVIGQVTSQPSGRTLIISAFGETIEITR